MLTTEMIETIKNSFLADLEYALEIETDPEIIAAITAEIERRNK